METKGGVALCFLFLGQEHRAEVETAQHSLKGGPVDRERVELFVIDVVLREEAK